MICEDIKMTKKLEDFKTRIKQFKRKRKEE